MAAVRQVVLLCLVQGVAACALQVLRRVCGGELAERGAVHLAGMVLAAQHTEGSKENTRAQRESATAQSSRHGLFGPCSDIKKKEKRLRKKEAENEKKLLWRLQNLRMNAFDARLNAGMHKDEEKE